MGYETFYELTIFKLRLQEQTVFYDAVPRDKWDEFKFEENVTKESDLWYAMREDGVELRWYDHEDDMKEFSKRYPNLLFKLSGTGESNGDIWIQYYHDGICWYWELEVEYPSICDMFGLMDEVSRKMGVNPKEKNDESIHQPGELEAGADTECIAPAAGILR